MLGIDLELAGGEIFLPMVERGGAGDRGEMVAVREHPSEGELRRRAARLGADASERSLFFDCRSVHYWSKIPGWEGSMDVAEFRI